MHDNEIATYDELVSLYIERDRECARLRAELIVAQKENSVLIEKNDVLESRLAKAKTIFKAQKSEISSLKQATIQKAKKRQIVSALTDSDMRKSDALFEALQNGMTEMLSKSNRKFLLKLQALQSGDKNPSSNSESRVFWQYPDQNWFPESNSGKGDISSDPEMVITRMIDQKSKSPWSCSVGKTPLDFEYVLGWQDETPLIEPKADTESFKKTSKSFTGYAVGVIQNVTQNAGGLRVIWADGQNVVHTLIVDPSKRSTFKKQFIDRGDEEEIHHFYVGQRMLCYLHLGVTKRTFPFSVCNDYAIVTEPFCEAFSVPDEQLMWRLSRTYENKTDYFQSYKPTNYRRK